MKAIYFKRIAAMMLFAFLTTFVSLSAKDSDTVESKFKTSAYSFMCKNKIESELMKIEGIIDVYLELNDKIVTIKYNKTKLNDDKIIKELDKLGYDSVLVKEASPASDKTYHKSTCNSNQLYLP